MINLTEILKYKIEILIVFFGSLLSFYFASLGGIRIFDFISLLLLIFLLLYKKKSFFIDKRIQIFFIFFACFVTISFLISILNGVSDIHLPRITGTYIAIFYSILFFSFFSKNVPALIVGVKYTVYIHSLFFYLQFLSFNFLGKYIDFLEPITGNNSRNMGGQFNLDTSIRASGLYSEPAIYSLFVLAFMSIYIYYKRNIGIIDIFVLLSVLLTMSSSGLVYLIGFIAIFFFYYSKSKLLNKVLVFFTGILLFFFIYQSKVIDLEYVYNKAVNYEESSSYQYRVGNTEEVLGNLTFFEQIFGIGYANMDMKGDKGSTYSAVFIEQGYFLGSIFFIALIVLLISFRTNIGVILYVFLLFFGTLAFSQIQFWIWLLSILIVSNYLTNERKFIL